MQDRAYFNPIIQQMDNGGREAMLYDLLEYDLDGIDLRKFPHTQARLDQIIASMSSVKKFWLEKLTEGILDDDLSPDNDWDNVKTKYLYDQYKEQARSLGERYPCSANQFGKELRELCPGIERRKIDSGCERGWRYVFPDLGACRNAFEDFVGQKIPWE